jgi:aspartyl-tRNA(Asn)/glutamyl-tRNA(Gln) amidotransferase subunit A
MRTIKELSKDYRDGKASPIQTTERLLHAIESINPKLNCFITVLRDSAMRDAEEAEKMLKEGTDLGPLQGIPLAVKDLFYIRGVKCTAGSKILASNVATYDATAVRRLKEAGAVIIGTTNMHEFASGITNENPHYGPVRNPWDTDRLSGGSSGGSAASVSAGLAVAAMGTDTAGSIRVPAALCGLVGFKPTYGLISRIGVIPLASSFDTVGTLTRSSWDAAALLDVLAWHDEGDISTADIGRPGFTRDATKLLKRTVRVGVPRRYFLDILDPGVSAEFERFLNRLAELDCESGATEIEGIENVQDVFFPIRRAEASAFHEAWLASFPELYGDDVRAALELGEKVPAPRYISAQNSRPAMRETFLRAMSGFDFLAVPTAAIGAPKVGQKTVRVMGGEQEVPATLIRLTLPFSVVGFPAMSLPVGKTDGLPVGVQLVARPFEESVLLNFANRYEEKYGLFPGPPVSAEDLP